MNMTSLSSAALIGVGIALGIAHPSAVSQSSAPSPPPPFKEIHVDFSCKILLGESSALSGFTSADLENDHTICHAEGAHASQHVEEALRNGQRLRSTVTVVEQEYMLQNVTSEPVAFVVEYPVPSDWSVDSDPQPQKIVDNIAFFRVLAQPGQIVRLHVGQRHADPIDNAN